MTAGPTSPGWFRQPARIQRMLRWGLLVFFLWLTGRFWHPYYGFTRFVQFDDSDAAITLPELREAPIYVYHYAGGYDGVAYAQLAVRPSARGPDLDRAIDSLPYRARRILLSWVAHVIGWGNPARVVHAYAALNLVVWFALAALLAKIFPSTGWRNLAAWGGLLFSAGVLHSVRLALTDLAAFALLAGAVWQAGRARETAAAGWLGAAGLVRETALLGCVSLVPENWRQRPGATLARGLLAVLPLGLWLVYLKMNTGPVVNGLGNFDWPFLGWVGKLTELWRLPDAEAVTWLAATSWLAFGGLTAQLLYVALRPEPRDRWWRLGAAYGALLLCLGPAVWAGHPGAATRILLPLALAFNVLAVRRRAAAAWLIAGNLSVFSGVLALWHVPQDPHEVAAGRAAAGRYVARTDAHWYGTERGRDKTWAWCGKQGMVELDLWPRFTGTAAVRVAVRGFDPRALEISQDARQLWSGAVDEKLRWVELPAVAMTDGRARLELSSPAAPVREGPAADARELGFALYGVKID